MQTQILAIRAALVAKLSEALGPVPVEPHHYAKCTQEHLDHVLANRALCVRVSFLGNPREGAEYDMVNVGAPFQWAAWICAKDGAQGGLGRHDMILSVLPIVLATIAKNNLDTYADWKVGDGDTSLNVHRATKIYAQETYQGELGKNSQAIWMVAWTQEVELVDVSANNDLRDLLTLITNYDLATPDAPHGDKVIEASDTISMPTD